MTRALLFFFILFLGKAFAQKPNINYNSPQIYITGTTIAPLLPNNTGGSVPANVAGSMTTLAGSGVMTPLKDGTGSDANFTGPTGIWADKNSDLYVVDQGNAIRKVTSAGVVTTIAGNGDYGSTNGPGTIAKFYYPTGVVMDSSGNLFIADYGNGLIRKITPLGFVTTFIRPSSAPKAIAIDAADNIYVTEPLAHTMEKITSTGTVIPFGAAGTVGTNASPLFTDPNSVAVDAAGNLYVVDNNTKIIKVTSAGITTVLATSPVPLGNIGYNALTIDRASGTLYAIIRGTGSQIEQIDADGTISFISISPDLSASSYSFFGMAYLAGKLFVVDYSSQAGYGNKVRQIDLTGYSINHTLPPGLTFDIKTGIISGTPTAAYPATDYIVTARNSSGVSSSTVNIKISAPPQASVINFPTPVNAPVDSDNILRPVISSNNTETPITYASSNPSVAFVGTDGLIHVIAPGITVITASQSGNANFLPATPVSQTYIIMQGQVILFPPIPAKLICDADFNAGAVSSNSLLPITYFSSNPDIATVSSQGVIHILAAGTTVITASQSGNVLYNDASPQSQLLTVSLPVVPLVTITPDHTEICKGSTVVFQAIVSNVTTNVSYQWKVNGINAGSNASTFATASAQTGDVFQCIVTNTVSCNVTGASNSYSGIIVDEYITPMVKITSSQNAPVCSGTSITFTAEPVNGGNNPVYQWTINGIDQGINASSLVLSNFADGDKVACKLTRSNGNCLTASTVTSNEITVGIITSADPMPSVTIMASANNAFTGSLIRFTALPANAGTILSYQWQVNGENVSNESAFSSNVLKNNDVVTCTIVSNVPCSVPAMSPPITMSLLPPENIYVVNTFSPNGDGINDTWKISELINFPNCVVNVYNRYGKIVFHSIGYTNNWDGAVAGKPLPLSTYYYVIDLGYKNERLSGSITIVR